MKGGPRLTAPLETVEKMSPSMNISPKTWAKFLFWSLISCVAWAYFTYSQFAFVNLSVGRSEAMQTARDFLKTRDVDVQSYQQAIIFIEAGHSDRYLQKALGFKSAVAFTKEHDLEMFFWKNRFFRENEKEEYHVYVSAATGQIIRFRHVIEENAARPVISQTAARTKAVAFLEKQFGFDPEHYVLQSDLTQTYDNRKDYAFSWKKDIPPVKWNDDPDSSGAKIIIEATVSGEEIVTFNKDFLKIPNDFNRFLTKNAEVGRNLAVLFRILFFTLLTSSIFIVIVRRNNLVLHSVKKFFIGITVGLFLLHLAAHWNHYNGILMSYPTTAPFISFFWRYTMNMLMDLFIITVGILMPSLAGESLHYEILPRHRPGQFLHFIRTSFLTRDVARMIFLGYSVAVIMFGIQSLAFAIGQKYLGVWVEYTWMSHMTESYLPFLTALVIGCNAAFTEEITFRMFSISLGKKIFKKTSIAVFLAAVIWGYGHSSYPVFPMWFRGLEVTCLGIFLSWIYLRYGIITVIVAHYLFDVFWISAAFLLGKSTPTLFFSSLAILLLPLGFALAAYLINKPQTERPLRWRLTKHQLYNLEVLKNYLRQRYPDNMPAAETLKHEIVSHGWDVAVVEIALQDIQRDNANNHSQNPDKEEK